MMPVPDDIWDRLEQGTADERVRAARRLSEYATQEDLRRIRELAHRESEELPRGLLLQAVDRLVADERDRQSPPDGKEFERQATRELAGLFLHELGPLLGMLELEVSNSLSSYGSSRPKELIDRIRGFLGTIRRLQEASSRPIAVEVDLTQLVTDVLTDVAAELELKGGESLSSPVPVELARQDHFVVTTDPELVRLALANGLRNAIEACREWNGDERVRVIINWGVTDRDIWISVLDEGCGLPLGGGDLFASCQTTRHGEGHLGMGLAIAVKAIEGLNGTVSLLPRDPRGARYELRWPKILP